MRSNVGLVYKVPVGLGVHWPLESARAEKVGNRGFIPRRCYHRCHGPTGSGKAHSLNGPRLVLDGLGFKPPPAIALGVLLHPEKPAPNLDIMQHYILPAESPILRLLAKNYDERRKHRKTILLACPAVRPRKQKQGGGKTALKPMALSERQRISQGIKFLVDSSDRREKPRKSRANRLAREIMMTAQGESPAITKKSDLHEVGVNRGNLPKRY